MGLRFRKSFKVAPGVRVNVGKSGVGMSVGGRGLRYSVHSSGRKTSTVGIPGSGISYSSTSSSRSYKRDAYKRRNELARLERDRQKLQEQEYARLQVELYENRLDQIRSIHHECDDEVDWDEVYSRKAPFEEGQAGQNERQAREQLQRYQPGFFDRLFKRDEAKKRKLEEEVQAAIQKDQELMNEWKYMHDVSKRILEKDVDAYFEVIDEFRPLDELVEFGSGFEFGTDQPDLIHVSFDVNAKDAVPEKALSLTKTGKLSEKNLTKTTYYDLYQDYVCSCALRIARDLFALLPVQHVFVHAYEERLNTATGHEDKGAILSVKYDKPTLKHLNFTNLDPSDALKNFEHQMNFKKTKGFEEVKEILD
ncbi:DUF4236 domain-containing protein [Bacillus sp. ISL-35]|uniref:DUF4236 domain-containing protein n=1 Tax=Bacillus sp. ISL-35 TaxID=2819122 RepID=UPI001BE8497F|nr:DUF4236 domain-containing protein [Bacillus sp. ISL-35]MBT2680610.1 DUF4236 domain-containing protein [Bacillus sp. ISL-35]MBT2704095.1 DUF4236 domain-containing protein [Chryseobacterium sp. ISL-80]